jgi:hypothetical protein
MNLPTFSAIRRIDSSLTLTAFLTPLAHTGAIKKGVFNPLKTPANGWACPGEFKTKKGTA